jgi:curved DNA-binding protein CbpA
MRHVPIGGSKIWIIVAVCIFPWIQLCDSNTASETIDLYKLLGVSRQATIKEIKHAYRRKALDTHPDKNTNIPPEEANDAFREVVRAFEILSDTTARQYYDRTGRTPDDTQQHHHQNNQQYGQYHNFHFRWSGNARRILMKDRFDVRQAQSRVLHIVSLTQLQTIMLDDDDVLERNILICITTPQTDVHADDEMVFPYPFAHMSSQGIWWEDLLQTIRIKFYRTSELSKFFNVTATDVNEKPMFIFGKRGTPLNYDTARNLPRLHTRSREQFEAWVWEQIQVRVRFINRHTHPIELYWVHGTTANLKEIVQPNHDVWHTTMLSHEWYVRDVRVDTYKDAYGRYKLTTDSSLGTYKIKNDSNPQEIIIQPNQCFDLSGHCSFWHHHENACHTNPNFMREHCQKTCGTCANSTKDDNSNDDDDDDEEEEEELEGEENSEVDEDESGKEKDDDKGDEEILEQQDHDEL